MEWSTRNRILRAWARTRAERARRAHFARAARRHDPFLGDEKLFAKREEQLRKRADRVAPNRVVYTAAIGACGSQGQWVQVALRAPPGTEGLAMAVAPLPCRASLCRGHG